MAILRYEYDIIGQSKVAASLASMERLFSQHSARLGRMAQQGSRGGSRATTQGEIASAERAATQSARTRQREIDQQVRSQLSLTRQRAREERDAERAALQSTRQRQRAIDQQVRSQAQLSRQREREEKASLEATRQIVHERRQFVQGTLGRGVGRVVNGLTAVGRAGAAMVGIGGAALAATSVQQAMSLDDQSRRLAIQGRGEGQAGANPDDLRSAFVRTGISAGIAPEQVAAGAAAYVQRTGDLDTAMSNLDTFATTAQATGASIEDVARAAADMSQKLDIKTVDDMRQALALLTVQGKRGAFELKDMAVQFPEMAASAANAGVRGVQGVRELGGIAQIAMQATKSGAEASTSVEAMFRQLQAKSGDIQSGAAFGGKKVQVFQGGDAKKPMRNFLDVIGDVMQASGGNIVQLQDVFDVRGIRAVNPLISAYRTANQAAGGGKNGDKAGRDAMQKVLEPFLSAPGDFGEIQRDSRDAMKSMSVQVEILNNKLKKAIASELFPAVERVVPHLVELIPTVAGVAKAFIGLVDWLASNPLSGLGIAVAASIAYELAKARVGAVVAAVLAAILRQRGGGGGIPTAPGSPAPGGGGGGFFGRPTASGALGAVGTGLALGAGVAAGIYAGGVMDYNTREASMNAQGDALASVRNLTGAGDAGAAREAVQAQRRRVQELQNVGVFDAVGEGAYHLIGGGPTQREVELNTAKSFLDEMEGRLKALDSLKDLADKLAQAGTSQKEAAELTKKAAERLGLVPNRSDSPSSPVKG
jgi:hypothetical protein